MPSCYLDTQLLRYKGTGNVTGTLDASGANTDALTGGTWEIWATERFQFQINSASGTSFGAKPAVYPADYVVVVTIPIGTTRYLGIKRVDTDGTYYANHVSDPV